ncbi:MAG: hypothetical protein HY887_04480 [Deltaproteobacteria bacterium]|nr:hypothetical protein [Deltaproteobacteria bacterium]
MKNLKRLALTAVAAVAMGLAASAPSWAIHKGAGGLVCGGCHTMHNSQGRTSLDGLSTNFNGADSTAGGGSLILLRASVSSRAEIHNLCLQCHSSNGLRGGEVHAPHGYTAPKVLLGSDVGITTQWNQDLSFSRIGAGGDFSNAATSSTTGTSATTWSFEAGDALGKGHSLGATNVMPPGAKEAALTYLTCTSCHDPHGVSQASTPGSDNSSAIANDYRMLRKYPTGSGGGTDPDSDGPFAIGNTATKNTSSYIGGITGESGTGNYLPIDANDGVSTLSGTTNARRAIWPISNADNPVSATGKNKYSAAVGNWCAACHDNWHESNDNLNIAGGQDAKGDWKRHPVNNVILEQACTSAGTEKTCSGAGVPIIDAAFPRYIANTAAPTAVPVADNATWYMAAPTTDASTAKVFCLSCHFPHGSPYNDLLRWNYTSAVGSGTQTGNEVPSDRGCQLCHNRGGM